MSDESFSHAALDAAPEDSAARLLLAEFYAERGDWRAEGYRWMAERAKWPMRNQHGHWAWWEEYGESDLTPDDRALGIVRDNHSSLPEKLCDRMDRVSLELTNNVAWAFPSRRDAEEALCRAVLSAAE